MIPARAPHASLRAAMLLMTGLAVVAGTVQAIADCDSNKPATPNNVTLLVDPQTPGRMYVQWEDGTKLGPGESTTINYDVWIRDANHADIGLDQKGIGPFTFPTTGKKPFTTIDGLEPGTTYCVAMKGRAGKNGCVSQVESNWACATTSGAAPSASLCKAYASAAVASVAAAKGHQCDFVLVPKPLGRWTANYQDHFNACTGWALDKQNGGMNDMNELLGRALDYGACLAKAAGVAPPISSSYYQGEKDPPTLDSFCGAYAYIASIQLRAARKLKCGSNNPIFNNPNGRWDPDPDHHRAACMSWNDQGAIAANETNARSEELVICEGKLNSSGLPRR